MAIYLGLFFGVKAWNYGGHRRTEYRVLVQEATALNTRLAVYDDKVAVCRKLMEEFRLDPARLSRTTLVAQASAAIQKAAMSGGVMLGPVRENPSRSGGKELTGIQMEAMGPPTQMMGFLQALGTLGFPLILDSVQLTPGPMGMAPMKANVSLMILDFDQWKAGEGRPDA